MCHFLAFGMLGGGGSLDYLAYIRWEGALLDASLLPCCVSAKLEIELLSSLDGSSETMSVLVHFGPPGSEGHTTFPHRRSRSFDGIKTYKIKTFFILRYLLDSAPHAVLPCLVSRAYAYSVRGEGEDFFSCLSSVA